MKNWRAEIKLLYLLEAISLYTTAQRSVNGEKINKWFLLNFVEYKRPTPRYLMGWITKKHQKEKKINVNTSTLCWNNVRKFVWCVMITCYIMKNCDHLASHASVTILCDAHTLYCERPWTSVYFESTANYKILIYVICYFSISI